MRPAYPARRWIPALALAAVGLSGCASVFGPHSNAAAPVTTRPRPTTSSTSPSTTVASTPTTVAPPATVPATTTTPTTPPPGLGQGASGAEVLALESRLAELRYDVGRVDGSYDSTTHHAVMAFQKVQGLPRSGRATPDVLAALPSALMPGALLAAGGSERVEIDLKRQVLLLFQGGQLVRTLSISTGNNKRYCVDGECATAVTPGGSFKVTRKIKGLRVSRLGKLYNPLYFNGGIAIHGSGSVPAGPASHGCVRIPMSASAWFHDAVPSGTPVYVIGGARAPVPFNEVAPGDPGVPTTTTLPPVETVPTTPPTTAPVVAPPPAPVPVPPLVPLPGPPPAASPPVPDTTVPPAPPIPPPG